MKRKLTKRGHKFEVHFFTTDYITAEKGGGVTGVSRRDTETRLTLQHSTNQRHRDTDNEADY